MLAYGYWGYPPRESAPRTINKNGYGRKYRQCVRCLQNCLCPPSQANRAGKMESQTREGRGEGSRPAGTRRAEQRMLARQRKLQAGEHGPAASVQAGSSVGVTCT